MFATDNPEIFWDALAERMLVWRTPYDKVMSGAGYETRWFEGGVLNMYDQCVTKHLASHGNKAAIIWENEREATQTITYRELDEQTRIFAAVLREKFDVKKGDRVVLYLPMIPEAVYAMLACARVGAIHVAVFSGFSAEVLAERIADVGAKVVITADGTVRKGNEYPLKPIVDVATKECDAKVLVVEKTHNDIQYRLGQDYSYDALKDGVVVADDPIGVASEDTLFVLHTSGSTGKPKGIQHAIAGYAMWARYTTELVLDIKPSDTLWCTADIGWITGHTYTVYGALMSGATTLLYEGAPAYPDVSRWWHLIETHGVTQFYTAPTALRLLKKMGEHEPRKHDLSSLRVLGTVGEPIDPETWHWYQNEVGHGSLPIIDTWWQTETGGHMIAPIPGVTPLEPGVASLPLPGVDARVVDGSGREVSRGEKGLLVITRPWPSMVRSVWNDEQRYRAVYFSDTSADEFCYISGDGAVRDKRGYITITGRVDDVMNVSGHRISSTEVEAVINEHPEIAESAVVGVPDIVTGERLVAFLVLKQDDGFAAEAAILQECNALLREDIGGIVSLGEIVVVDVFPKTRSGKVVRRLLRQLLLEEPITQDVSTLEDISAIEAIKKRLANG